MKTCSPGLCGQSKIEGMVPITYRCWMEVSRRQLAENFHAIRNAVGPGVEVMPVVKADAYRHGAAEVAKVLQQEGARWLAVSNVEEGVTLRQAGITAHILIMGDFLQFERPALIDYDLTPCIHSAPQLLDYNRMAAALGRPLPYHLAVDSGMAVSVRVTLGPRWPRPSSRPIAPDSKGS